MHPGSRPDHVRVLALEPYYGGSHRAVLDGLVRALEPEGFAFDVITLPARKWKWRMRGAAMTMSREVRSLWTERGGGRQWDVVFVSTFLGLAEFLGLAGEAVQGVPSIVYFHENQLVYPNRHTAEWDYQFPLTNITSALAADLCLFNTQWNLDRFAEEIPPFLASFPDHRPTGVADRVMAKSRVLAPPFDAAPFDDVLDEGRARSDRVRIVWPHRWEHDKDPESFFAAVLQLAKEGLDFEVAVAGQPFVETETLMREAALGLGDRLVHLGEPADIDEYARLLASSDIAVSTAINEFFGLAMVEACYCGCYPLVPDRLAYPGLYAPEHRYADHAMLVDRLRGLVGDRPEPFASRRMAERFTLAQLAGRYADTIREVAATG